MGSDAERWLRAGFDASSRAGFQAWKIPLGEALVWRSAGVPDGLDALRWSLAGVAPEQVALWREAGIDALEALQWHQHGFDLAGAVWERAPRGGASATDVDARPDLDGVHRPAVANAAGALVDRLGPAVMEWLKSGGPGRRGAYLYLDAGWVSDDALPWAHAGIPPETARMWLLLGFTPVEAVRVEGSGATVSSVVQDWWTAGVPLEQVVAWLGAGFTAREAQDSIGAGLDRQQAVVLRARRGDTDA